MKKTIKYIRQRIEQIQKIAQLDIAETGVDRDGDAFVRLKDGPVFYGEQAIPKDKKYYLTLAPRVRKKIPFEAMRVAIDIVARYKEAGLMYGGPFKDDKYSVARGDTTVEMGAFRGCFIVRLCEEVGPEGKVVAIEPMPDNVRILKKNLKANRIENCTVIEKGVWHEPDTMVFNRKEKDNQSSSLVIADHGKEQFSVPVDSLDNILAEANVNRCDFMVIQLNGVEIDALQGMTQVRPTHLAIAARYDKPGQNAIEEIGNWMDSNAYQFEVVKDRFIFAERQISKAK